MKLFNFALFGLLLHNLTASAAPLVEQEIILTEHLGHSWPSALVHRKIALKRGQFFPGRIALFLKPDMHRPLPVQLANIATHADGSLRLADVWFSLL